LFVLPQIFCNTTADILQWGMFVPLQLFLHTLLVNNYLSPISLPSFRSYGMLLANKQTFLSER